MTLAKSTNAFNSLHKRVCVVVLGDFGRSPRMQYHAMELSKCGFSVDVVSYGGSKPHPKIENDKKIYQRFMPESPNFGKYLPRIFSYILKTIWQTLVLFKYLMDLNKPTHILVQNPPSVATLPVSVLVCWLRKCSLAIDWHNYGYTVLGASLGDYHPVVKICCWIEGFFGTYGKDHFCVTRAMKEDLFATWHIRARVLYDRPSELFHPLSLEQKHNFLLELAELIPQLKHDDGGSKFTEIIDGCMQLRKKRPALLVSSTSWTLDEDFSLLLRALNDYEESFPVSDLPELICLVSGKGPMLDFYKREINKRNYQHVNIFTLWLPAQDYPKMLASADLGVCLHTSTSGLDLPMKVVDMFGCRLPVCAMAFGCLYELVKPGYNGQIFKNSQQLGQLLKEIFNNYPNGNGSKQVEIFKQNIDAFRSITWEKSWLEIALPVFIK